jgi:transcriptional regulator with XRE-family HTH domain
MAPWVFGCGPNLAFQRLPAYRRAGIVKTVKRFVKWRWGMGSFGDELRALMAARGIGGSELARLVPCDPGLVSRYLRGKQQPSRRMAARLDAVLQAGGSLIALVEDPDIQGAILTLDAAPKRPVAGTDYVTDLRQASQRLVDLDTRHGGNDVLAMATRTFQAAHYRLASGEYVPEIERDLQAAVGEAGEVAAWIAYDADKQALSRALCQEAMLVSRLAGDRSMELMQLGHLSMQGFHLRRSAEALRIADDVLCGPRMSGRVAALFHLRRGRALAQLGDRPRALAAICRSRSMLAEGIAARDPEWTWWIGETELKCHEAMALADLGDWQAAARLFGEASAQRGPLVRARYNDQTHLLDVLVHGEAWRDAEPVAADLASFTAEVGSARTANLLRRVTQRITRTVTTTTLADSAEELGRLLDVGELA